MLVMKFGGTSVGDSSCFLRVADIIARYRDQQPVVVVSAMGGVTNALLDLARQAQSGQDCVANGYLTALMNRHRAVVEEAVLEEEHRQPPSTSLDMYAEELRGILTGIRLLREATPRSLDATAAYGEKMSATILAAVLRDRGLPAVFVTAEDLIITDDNHGQATPVQPDTNDRICHHLTPLLRNARIPVITGFIARSISGATTTLSRGGSDFSASIIGAALQADEIWIWTDVNGVMTADPRAVPQAHTLPSLTYAEAAELSYFGAKVLHPKTVAPAIGRAIPIRIKNTFDPNGPDTLISRTSAGTEGTVRAMTSMPNMSLVTVQGAGMIGVPGVAGRVFSVVAALGASVMMISQSSSEYNMCFVVGQDWSQRVIAALRREFAHELDAGDISDIWAQNAAVLAVVGEGMRGTPGVAGRLFSALGRRGINVIAIAQGSSELNISFVVDEDKRVDALRCIHSEFIG